MTEVKSMDTIRVGRIIPRFTKGKAQFTADELIHLCQEVFEHVDGGYGGFGEALESALYDMDAQHPLLNDED